MLPAIASIGGSLIEAFGQGQTNVANARQAQQNRDFQERMSNTQYQRATADMRAAGLNPALAYQQGGAGTPTGSTAQIQNPAAGAGGTAKAAAQTFNEVSTARVNRQLTEATTLKTAAEARQINLESQDRLAEIKGRTDQAVTTADQARRMGPFARAHVGTQADLTSEQAKTEKELRALRAVLLGAEADYSRTHARESTSRTVLQELGAPQLRNRAEAQKSWWMRKVSPYLNDAAQVTRSLPGVLLNVRRPGFRGQKTPHRRPGEWD